MMQLLFLTILIYITFQKEESKTIIIYFSRPGENYGVGTVDIGNTEMIVEYLKQITSITVYKINPETPYPVSYEETKTIANSERDSGARPAIKDPLTDISNYDTILLGYPIWGGNLPNIVINQLEKLSNKTNWKEKTIYPFNTHEGSGVGNSINDIKNYAKNAVVKDGFAIKGTDARKAESHEKILKWLNEQVGINSNKGIYIKNHLYLLIFMIFLI